MRSVTARPRSIAIEAALTGHLVLSTLHTNDAASTPLRLVEMGVEPFLVTSALDCVRRPAARPPALRQVQGAVPADRGRARRGRLADGGRSTAATGRRCTARVGCPACGRTGYRGRFALHEVMLVTEEIERLIIERRSTEDIQKVAVMQGMITLRDDGLRKVGMGLTCLEEIFRVVA